MIQIKSMSRFVIEMNNNNYNFSINPNISYDYFYVESVNVPFVFDNIPDTEVSFFDTLDVQHIFLIPAGLYNVKYFLDLLIADFNSNESGGQTYSYILNNDNTATISVTGLGSSFAFLILNPITQQRSGFISNPSPLFSVNGSITSQKFSYFPKLLLFTMDPAIIGQGNYTNINDPTLNQNLSLSARSQYLFVVPIGELDILGQSISQFYGSNNTTHPLNKARLGAIKISVTDELLKPINIFPQRLYLTLVFYNI
jgi:hypothetical protein